MKLEQKSLMETVPLVLICLDPDLVLRLYNLAFLHLLAG